MPLFVQVVRRVAAVLTAIAVCGMFAARAEGTTNVRQTQLSATKTTALLAVLVSDESGTPLASDGLLEFVGIESSGVDVPTGKPRIDGGSPCVAAPVWAPTLSRLLVGTIELRL